MEYKNKRAGGGALEGLRLDCDTHLTPEKPQGKSPRDRARDLLTELRGRYPVLAEYRPLSIGIREALHAAEPDVKRQTISRGLAMHCHSGNYLKRLAAGGPRYGLDGTPSGSISEAHRAVAKLMLARRSEKSGKPRNPAVVSAAPKRLAKTGRPA